MAVKRHYFEWSQVHKRGWILDRGLISCTKPRPDSLEVIKIRKGRGFSEYNIQSLNNRYSPKERKAV